MIGIRLSVGDTWLIGSERYVLDQVMGSDLLHLRSERTGSPLQVPDTSGNLLSPSREWLTEQFGLGLVHKVETVSVNSRTAYRNSAGFGDYEMTASKDPKAVFRQTVLKALDRLGSYSRSNEGIKLALASISRSKPETFSKYAPPSPSTVRRWLKARGQTGERTLKAMVSYSGRTSRKKRLPASVRKRLHRHALSFWSNLRQSIGDAYDDLRFALSRLNAWITNRSSKWRTVPIPSKETFRKQVRALECYETIAARYGKKAADHRFKATGQGLRARRPLLLGAMDHTQVDYHVAVNFKGWRLLGRPWLTKIMDVHSRCIVGWVLSFEPPSLYSVTECIKRANRPKLRMADRFPDRPELVEIHGKFDEIIVDNGWEFTGTSFESAMVDMGVSVRGAPVRSPTFKAIIERYFGTLNTRLHRKLPGGTFPIEQLRAWDLDPRKDAVLTLEQVEDLLISAIGTYHQELHSTLMEAPVTVWSRETFKQGGIQVIGDDRQLDKMLGARTDATLTRSGITLFNLQFHDPEITGPMLEDLARTEPIRGRRKGSATARVEVKYNPADLDHINVWYPRLGQFIELPCTDPEYASGLCKWRHDLLQTWVREEQHEDADERCRRRVELRKEIEAITPDRILTRSKRAQARLLSSPKIEAMASNAIRVKYAPARHDGMAPIIQTKPMASERTDNHEKPVRPPRGKPKTQKRPTKARPQAQIPETAWVDAVQNAQKWEDFQ